MRELLPPQKMLADINEALPWIWRKVDEVRAARGTELPDWDKSVFLPMSGWGRVFSGTVDKHNLQSKEFALMEMCAILGAWRPGQDVVRFDQVLYSLLLDTPFNGNLPSEILWRLPAWAVYVDTPGLEAMGGNFDGFVAMLNEKTDGGRELRLMFLNSRGESLVEFLSLGDWGLEKSFVMEQPGIIAKPGSSFTLPEGGRPREAYPALKIAISLLLYICAYGFLDDKRATLSSPSYPAAKRTKKGWRLFPPDKPVIHEVGKEIGNNLRNFCHAAHISTGDRKAPRPHLRRAHWHGFWSGPKKEPEKRRFDLTWLPPIPVAMGEEGEATFNSQGVAL